LRQSDGDAYQRPAAKKNREGPVTGEIEGSGAVDVSHYVSSADELR